MPPGRLDQATRRSLATLARTALRETFEETGLLISSQDSTPDPGRAASGAPVWQAYRAQGAVPPFSDLRLVARAITPRASPIRFHTRFFLVTGGRSTAAAGTDGELVDVHWASLGTLDRLPMSSVTRLVLEEALLHRAGAPASGRAAARFAWAGPADWPRFLRDPPLDAT